MPVPELLFPLCSVCSWPCCTGQEPLFSPISAPRFCLEPESFGSEEDVCCLPLCSAQRGVQLSTRAALPSLSELLFPGWEISACCSRYISVPEALKKTKDSFTCRSLQPWKMRKSTELGIRPASQQNYFPLCPLCFTWCSWMSLKRLLKKLFPKFLLFSGWTISIGGFLERAKNVIIVINLNKLQTMQNLIWFLQSLGINECWWSDNIFLCLPWSPQFCYFG